MQVNNPFDPLAVEYDKLFTYTPVGMAQREVVRKHLVRQINPGMKILEIGCGTGEDAFFLAAKGCRVIATDASSAMIELCMKKAAERNVESVPEFHQLAFNRLDSLRKDKNFDLVFSNFSGLNCLENQDLKSSSMILHKLLKPGGSICLVLFGKNCLWEKLYMLFKGRFYDINRRINKQMVSVQISDSGIPVYYYSPKELRKLLKDDFKFITVKPVGMFLPPTYLDPLFRNKKFLLHILGIMERIISNISLLSNLADHYYIEFRRL